MVVTDEVPLAKKKLYCICQTPYDNSRLMVGCDICNNWFHVQCVGLSDDQVQDIETYVCETCKDDDAESETLEANGQLSDAGDEENLDEVDSQLIIETPPILPPPKKKSITPKKVTPAKNKSPTKSTVAQKTKKANQNSGGGVKDESELYCLCRMPYDDSQFYICCDSCQDWFHGRCVGVVQSEASAIEEYICPKCKKDSNINHANLKDLDLADIENLRKLLGSMKTHKHSWPFLAPVDLKDVPDYYNVIKEPMDLKTMESKLNTGKYTNLAQFIGDMTKVFDNCRYYNDRKSPFYNCAEQLEAFFVQKIKTFRDQMI
jgi:hypothetical protein